MSFIFGTLAYLILLFVALLFIKAASRSEDRIHCLKGIPITQPGNTEEPVSASRIIAVGGSMRKAQGSGTQWVKVLH